MYSMSLLSEYSKQKEDKNFVDSIIKALSLFADKRCVDVICEMKNKPLLESILDNAMYFKIDIIKQITDTYVKCGITKAEKERVENIYNIYKFDKEGVKTYELIYQGFVNSRIYIQPNNNMNLSKFSIEPELPQGIKLDNETGVISGITNVSLASQYTVTYINNRDKYQDKIMIAIVDPSFDYTLVTKSIAFSDKNRIEKIVDDRIFGYCFLNFEMTEGIYHLLFKYKGKNMDDGLVLGANPHITMHNNLFGAANTIAFYISKVKSGVYLSGQKIKALKQRNQNEEIYEMIFDMDEHILYVKFSDGKIVELKRNLPHVLNPFVEIAYSHCSVEILKVTKTYE